MIDSEEDISRMSYTSLFKQLRKAHHILSLSKTVNS